MAWEIVVGIETHAQLATKSKMFSGASTEFGKPPNTQAAAVDIALPGVLPVANAAAVECAIRFGLAVGGERPAGWNINRRSVFARKNYFYPDLPKGYQISQYELPIVTGGAVRIALGSGAKKVIRLTRAHLEEDAGKSLHEDFHGMTGIDLNRAGTPLLEIVSEPELRGAAEAVAYARALHELVTWIEICDGNMEEGSFRCDANVSVRRQGDERLGTRCEIKNLNSFRFMEQAIEFEARRQVGLLEDGGSIAQETRLFDPDKGETRSMRTKEDAQDYRYFPDPDLLPLVVSDRDIERIRVSVPELPDEKRSRYVASGLSDYQAMLLTSSREISELADETFKGVPRSEIPRLANFIAGPITALLKQEQSAADGAVSTDTPAAKFRIRISPEELRKLGASVSTGTVSSSTATGVIIPILWSGEGRVEEIIKARGLEQISDSAEIEREIDKVLAASPKQVADYKSGKEKALQSLVGQVMKATQGKANPAQVNAILKAKLGSR